jgi:DNA-binding response OmpR family regulator
MDQNNFRPLTYIVNDETMIAGSLAAILRRNGLHAMAFTDPRRALSQARLIPPQLLVVDLALPAISGVDLAVAMSEIVPNCRFLFLYSSSQAQTLLDRPRRRGYCFELVSKPINPRVLFAKCNRLAIQPIDPFVSSVLPGVPFN